MLGPLRLISRQFKYYVAIVIVAAYYSRWPVRPAEVRGGQVEVKIGENVAAGWTSEVIAEGLKNELVCDRSTLLFRPRRFLLPLLPMHLTAPPL